MSTTTSVRLGPVAVQRGLSHPLLLLGPVQTNHFIKTTLPPKTNNVISVKNKRKLPLHRWMPSNDLCPGPAAYGRTVPLSHTKNEWVFFFQQPLHRKPPKRTQTWATKSEIENRFHLPRQDFNHYTAKPFVPCPPASMIADDRRKSLIIVFVLLFKRRYQCVVLRCCLLGRWLTNCLPRRFGPQATRTDRAYQLASWPLFGGHNRKRRTTLAERCSWWDRTGDRCCNNARNCI